MAARSAAVVLAVLALSQEPGGVQVSVVRFYRSANALTLVDAFCRVPVSAVSALSSGGVSAGAAYGVSVVVHDSAGTELTSQTWSQAVPARCWACRGHRWSGTLRLQGRVGRMWSTWRG